MDSLRSYLLEQSSDLRLKSMISALFRLNKATGNATLFNRIISEIGSNRTLLNGDYFRLGKECPSSFNPADFYIHALAILPGQEEESRKQIKVRYSFL